MKTFDQFIIEEQIRMCRSLEDYEVKYFRIAWDAALRGNTEPVAEVPCSAGLGGISQLINPDYHTMSTNDRLLHACLCAYTKHQHDNQHIGWDELGNILLDAICEAVGDDAFCKWNESIEK